MDAFYNTQPNPSVPTDTQLSK